jgi:hypothetical protein
MREHMHYSTQALPGTGGEGGTGSQLLQSAAIQSCEQKRHRLRQELRDRGGRFISDSPQQPHHLLCLQCVTSCTLAKPINKRPACGKELESTPELGWAKSYDRYIGDIVSANISGDIADTSVIIDNIDRYMTDI